MLAGRALENNWGVQESSGRSAHRQLRLGTRLREGGRDGAQRCPARHTEAQVRAPLLRIFCLQVCNGFLGIVVSTPRLLASARGVQRSAVDRERMRPGRAPPPSPTWRSQKLTRSSLAGRRTDTAQTKMNY